MQLGKNIYLRLHNIYGPRMGYSHVIPELKSFAAKNKSIFLFFKEHFVLLMMQLIKYILSFTKKQQNKIYNIGNKKNKYI